MRMVAGFKFQVAGSASHEDPEHLKTRTQEHRTRGDHYHPPAPLDSDVCQVQHAIRVPGASGSTAYTRS